MSDMGVAAPSDSDLQVAAQRLRVDLHEILHDWQTVDEIPPAVLESTSLHATQLVTLLDAHIQQRHVAARPQEEAHSDEGSDS